MSRKVWTGKCSQWYRVSLPMQEMVWDPGWGRSLEEEPAAHPSILLEDPWTEESKIASV